MTIGMLTCLPSVAATRYRYRMVENPSQLAVGSERTSGAHSHPASSQHSSMRRSHASQSSQISQGSAYDYRADSIHPFPAFNSAARVDAGGTGGLAEPSADGRRQSYDEGDEYSFLEGSGQDRFPDEPLDIYYQPASTSYRPLPPPPDGAPAPLQTDSRGGYPIAPSGYSGNYAASQFVPRSTSLLSHTTTPQIAQPLRAKTDAEERRLRQQQLRTSGGYSAYETTPLSALPTVPLDLPSLPGKTVHAGSIRGSCFQEMRGAMERDVDSQMASNPY